MKKIIFAFALLSLCMGFVTGQSKAAQAAEAPSLSVSATTVQAGETLDFVGTGFIAYERLSVWVTTATGAVLAQPYEYGDRNGRVNFGYGIPSEAYAGRWALTVYGEETRKPVIASFDVIGRPAPQEPAAIASVTPSSGVIGTYFTFETEGYEKREKISYWFTGPDNRVYDPHEQEIRADSKGRVSFVWQAPAGIPLGKWVVTIQGIRSNTARGIPFELIAP